MGTIDSVPVGPFFPVLVEPTTVGTVIRICFLSHVVSLVASPCIVMSFQIGTRLIFNWSSSASTAHPKITSSAKGFGPVIVGTGHASECISSSNFFLSMATLEFPLFAFCLLALFAKDSFLFQSLLFPYPALLSSLSLPFFFFCIFFCIFEMQSSLNESTFNLCLSFFQSLKAFIPLVLYCAFRFNSSQFKGILHDLELPNHARCRVDQVEWQWPVIKRDSNC
mmetsp:Transcript_19354/g.41675  ORF Transcript_19354/g.41675 Transcript_19354/m.41675 type:complete len:223 (+) Transcript_19354:101-769(+)